MLVAKGRQEMIDDRWGFWGSPSFRQTKNRFVEWLDEHGGKPDVSVSASRVDGRLIEYRSEY